MLNHLLQSGVIDRSTIPRSIQVLFVPFHSLFKFYFLYLEILWMYQVFKLAQVCDIAWHFFSCLVSGMWWILHSTNCFPGLNKLHTRWRVFMQHALKEVFTCTKLCPHKSIKILLSSTWMFFKVASCFRARKQIIFGTKRSEIHNNFQLRSFC